MQLTKKWYQAIEKVAYSYQPLVNLQTGETYAVEALLGDVVLSGFPTIEAFFDTAFGETVLFGVDLELCRKAMGRFKDIPFHQKIKLFYNYDPRILEMPEYNTEAFEEVLNALQFPNDSLCFELNEQYKITKSKSFEPLIRGMKKRGFKLALDNFGVGFAGLELFYYSEPDYIKFDHFLINGIDKDYKKQTFCNYIVNLAKLLGVLVVAAGVETLDELKVCKKIGFDLVQGYFIQQPTKSPAEIKQKYPVVVQTSVGYFPSVSRDFELIDREIIPLDTIGVNDSIKVLFEKFHDNLRLNFFPVIDKSGFPIGIIHERDIKKYVYSPYGRDLLYNKSMNNSLRKFLSNCPICDINTPQEKILEIYINNPDSEGVIITHQQKYYGFLTAKSLLTIINEKNLALAREVNPLTKLPGNMMINRYIATANEDKNSYYYLIYFDLNNFKPFNDRFGFTQGDQVIIFLADLLKKAYHSSDSFIGHIGGDDFFVGLKRGMENLDDESDQVVKFIEFFNQSVRIFYAAKELQNGCYFSKDRTGKRKQFPLLSVSAAILELSPVSCGLSPDEITKKLADLKKEAKKSNSHIFVSRITETVSL